MNDISKYSILFSRTPKRFLETVESEIKKYVKMMIFSRSFDELDSGLEAEEYGKIMLLFKCI